MAKEADARHRQSAGVSVSRRQERRGQEWVVDGLQTNHGPRGHPGPHLAGAQRRRPLTILTLVPQPASQLQFRIGEFRDRPAGQNQRLHRTHPLHNKTGAEDVGNSTSTTPVRHVSGLNPRSVSEAYSSPAGSSPSASRSAGPARICSAIRPEFCRIAVSILATMSGLALRKAFEFSRPWPSRWLS